MGHGKAEIETKMTWGSCPYVAVMTIKDENGDRNTTRGVQKQCNGIEELGKGFLKLKAVAGGKKKGGLQQAWVGAN